MADIPRRDRRPIAVSRRAVLRAATATSAAAALATLVQSGAAATPVDPEPTTRADRGDVFSVDREGVEAVFPQSVASGGPTPGGVLCWTRIAPDAYDPATDLGVEVAMDDTFTDVVFRGVVPAEAVSPDDDYCVTVDLDGLLAADRHYCFRFVYRGDASRVGRCRTLPAPDASPARLALGVLSCNNYRHGYFGALAHVASEDLDYLLHLGDFIYEYGGETDVPGRDIQLPSGHDLAWTLADFRHLHRTYRSDPFMQRALERHTLLHVWDDHEIVNDRWWNAETDAPETTDHPMGGDPEFMRQLSVAGITAMTEYVPSRILEPDGRLATDRIHDEVRLYRSLRFGDLATLFLTDERLYRSPPPVEDTEDGRPDSTPPWGPGTAGDPTRTMLGAAQRRWFVDGVTESDATWKLWGNEVLVSPLSFGKGDSQRQNFDAWDGFRFERRYLLREFARAGVRNLVTLTGDMHSYLVGYLLDTSDGLDSPAALPPPEDRVGVEFMTPAVSSDNLAALGAIPASLGERLADHVVRAQNPHLAWFNSSRWGYTTLELTPEDCVWTAWGVDRTENSADAEKTLLRRFRVPEGRVELERLD
ncbi:alkaline phosphatase D family protein [Haloarchaeobius sp. TZWSO28]|uniref:alkaline phosphatase D family protein n=1 Tax=Haloarchaeobius sp. TZWSO28 TaxID=3446119 RepID=UPI003EB9F41C